MFIFNITCLLFLLISIRWLGGIFYAHRWIKNELNRVQSIATKSAPLFVLIPVLSEVGRIEQTVDYFLDTFAKRINLRIVLITSELEYAYYKRRPNTIDVCKSLERQYDDRVIHCHYPYTTGRMSHQLNYAIHQLAPQMNGESLLVVYNADSKPDPLTFDWVIFQREQNSSLQVFQQYGDYTRNVGKRTNSILLSAALWQNRWAIGFELYKALRSMRVYQKLGIRRPLNYVIGHGLFMTKSVYDKSIGFSEVFHNEDAILGLEFSFLGERITPLPFFDVSDTPDTVKSLYTQKIHWFFGPYQAFQYFAYLKTKYNIRSAQEKRTLFLQSFKLFFHAVYWVVGPIAMLFLFLYPIISQRFYLFGMSYGIFLLFYVLPNILSLALVKPKEDRSFLFVMYCSLATGGIICYALHGLSALSAVGLSLRKMFTRRQIAKGKTVMKNL